MADTRTGSNAPPVARAAAAACNAVPEAGRISPARVRRIQFPAHPGRVLRAGRALLGDALLGDSARAVLVTIKAIAVVVAALRASAAPLPSSP